MGPPKENLWMEVIQYKTAHPSSKIRADFVPTHAEETNKKIIRNNKILKTEKSKIVSSSCALASSQRQNSPWRKVLTTMPISFLSAPLISTVLSSTRFMNWSNPRSTPITFLPAFSLTANPNDSPGQKAKPILHPSFTILEENFQKWN